MKYKVIIENKNAGKVMEAMVEGSIKVDFNRVGTPAKLECNIVKDSNLSYGEGNPLAFYIDDKLFFYGYVIKKGRDKEQIIKTTAMDQLFYFKNQDTFQYKDLTYSGLLQKIISKQHLKAGDIEDTKVKIPHRIEKNKEYYNILQYASDYTTAYGGKMYVLFDKGGKINLKEINNLKVDYPVTYDNAVNFDYNTSIEKGVYNRVYLRLLDDKGKEIKHAKAEDSKNIKDWGLLNYTDTTNNEEIDIDKKSKELLKVLNRKHRSLKVKNVIGNTEVRAGSVVPVIMSAIGDININSYMIVDKVTHTFSENEHFMTMDLINSDIQPTVSPKRMKDKNKKPTTETQPVTSEGGQISKGAEGAFNYMKKHIGAPYSQAKRLQPGYYDCSSAVMRAYQDVGLLPKQGYNLTTYTMINDKNFIEINKNELKPGDICWNQHHMEMYAGDGKTIGAHSPSKPLGYSILDGRSKPFTRYFRVKGCD